MVSKSLDGQRRMGNVACGRYPILSLLGDMLLNLMWRSPPGEVITYPFGSNPERMFDEELWTSSTNALYLHLVTLVWSLGWALLPWFYKSPGAFVSRLRAPLTHRSRALNFALQTMFAMCLAELIERLCAVWC